MGRRSSPRRRGPGPRAFHRPKRTSIARCRFCLPLGRSPIQFLGGKISSSQRSIRIISNRSRGFCIDVVGTRRVPATLQVVNDYDYYISCRRIDFSQAKVYELRGLEQLIMQSVSANRPHPNPLPTNLRSVPGRG